MSTSNRSLSQDNANGEKWDQCLTDGILKTAFGLTWGIVFSALLFKRRPWPIIFGTGIGIDKINRFRQHHQKANDLRGWKTNISFLSFFLLR
ncbi:unnamed protein product [Rotaria magnacalcarata]